MEKILYNNLKIERIKRNLTQEQLADLTNITRQTVSAIENGQYNPSIKLCLTLAEVLNVKIDILFFLLPHNEKQ